ncbi:Flp pilus assembly complex ATPase component TadA [bacterium]|nr:Flp pilus assembly complex ATPase component TadA [bacterium]
MKVEDLFTSMVEHRASHLHLVPGSPILMRINNQLVSMDSQILSPQDTRAFSEAIMNDPLREEFEDQLEVDFSFSVPGLSRFRVNAFKQRGSVAVVISTNPPAAPTLDELGIPELVKNIIKDSTSGLIICGGPKQCGKSCTLAAMVNYLLETRTCQIITLEDPIDFLHKNKRGVICQREVGNDVLSYEAGFAALKHQSADVVVVGNIDSYETVANVLPLASAGTLVLASCVSANVQGILEKIIDLCPAHLNQSVRNQMANGLRAVIGQVLLKSSSGQGLVPAFELLINSPQFKTLVRDNKLHQVQALMAASARDYGMQTQEMALRFLVKKNLITMEEATQHAARPEEFRKIMSMPY